LRKIASIVAPLTWKDKLNRPRSKPSTGFSEQSTG
jgi:hypothetical protein